MTKKLALLWLSVLVCFTTQAQKNLTANTLDIKLARINWKINPEHLYINGIVKYIFQKKNSTSDFILFDLNSSLSVDSIYHNQKSIYYIHENNLIKIKNSIFENSDSLTIYYSGIPNNSGFDTFTQTTHGEKNPIIWTLSEPYGAADWWPCQNNVEDKIDSLEITIICPKNYTGISNGILINTRKNDSIISYIWHHNYPIAPYLVAFAVTNYSHINLYFKMNAQDSVLIENFVYPEDSAKAREGIKAIEPAFRLFCDTYMPYPVASVKYGHAEFSWGGGMEHQTISFVSNFEFYLLVHEMSHQWFGDYITCGSFHDIWLNEGFAVFSESLCTEKLFGKAEFLNWKKARITRITSEVGGSVYVKDTTDIWRIFDGRLTYSKAGMVLQMLRSQIGDSAFFKGIRSYLHDPDLVNNFAMTGDLQRHFEASSGADLTHFFDEWIYGEGFPNYTVQYWFESNNCHIKLMQKPSASTPIFHLKVPIKISNSSSDTTLWLNMNKSTKRFDFPLNFRAKNIIFNPNYDIICKWKGVKNNFEKKKSSSTQIQ